jgi:hypothetical protein
MMAVVMSAKCHKATLPRRLTELTKLNTTDDETCRQAVTNNPQITYEDCRRDAIAKRNGPQDRQAAGGNTF